MKFKQEYSDETGWSRWIRPVLKGYRLGCCDCGLVHDMDFRVVDGHIEFKVRRNNRSTAAIRRKKVVCD